MNIRRRVGALTGAAVLTAGLAAGTAIAMPGTADAAVCTGALALSCSALGSVTLGGGVLTMLSPTTLTWGGTLNGQAQSLVDTLPTDIGYQVSDLTGSAAGWNVTATASPFTFVGTAPTGTAATFPNSGTLLNADSLTSESGSTSPPAATCVVALSCTLPTPGVQPTYPVALVTASASPPASLLYEAAGGTGSGLIQIGRSAIVTTGNPAAWWVNVPADAAAGVYTSTITMTIASAP